MKRILEILHLIALYAGRVLLGLSFAALTLGLITFIGGGLTYFAPFDAFKDQALYPHNPHSPEALRGLLIAKWGAVAFTAGTALAVLLLKLSSWRKAWLKAREARETSGETEERGFLGLAMDRLRRIIPKKSGPKDPEAAK